MFSDDELDAIRHTAYAQLRAEREAQDATARLLEQIRIALAVVRRQEAA